jgi:transposase InsO family protein
MTDRRCRFGLAARIEMVRRREAGESFRAIARSLACSPNTVRTAWARWQASDEQGRADFSCLHPRRPVPRSCPHALTAEQEQKILQARARTNWGPMRLTAVTGRHRATIWKVLKRHGVSRRRRPQRQTFCRYEWSAPGALLHLDTIQLPKFDRPGHRTTGDKSQRSRDVGTTFVVSVVDDHTRLAYSELHSFERGATVAATLRRAAVWMREQGCGPVEAVMTDNHAAHLSHEFRDTLTAMGAHHIRTPPYTPRWNGKVERFQQTLKAEWARCREWPNHRTRDRALSSYLRYYNRYRPHSAANGRPPITRVHQVRKHDT